MTDTTPSANGTQVAPPSLLEAVRVWARIGVLSFGGPTAQIALMHKEIVDQRGWLTEQQYLNALGFCMLLPGPEAMQLATYAGWRLHGLAGGLAAGLLFVLPGAVVILGLAMFYAAFASAPLVDAVFLGVQAAVIIVVIEALLRISKRALKGRAAWLIAAAAFLAIFAFGVPYPLIILAAALAGVLFIAPHDSQDDTGPIPATPLMRTGLMVLIWLLILWGPLLSLTLLDPGGRLFEIGNFFSRLAVVTFGGAYAVLAYMAQDVVQAYGWLTADEMLVSLGLAETTPGPLILVTEFVGYLAAERVGGIWYGVAGAAVALWATFVPCFLWIFAGAPYIDRIGHMPKLQGALAGITACVVGVILNLTLWFALHVFFTEITTGQTGPIRIPVPDPTSLNPVAAGLTLLCAVLAFGLHWGIGRILAVSAALAGVIGWVSL